MRFYLDIGAGMETRAVPDLEEQRRFLKMRGAKNIRTAKKYGWSNQPRVLTFDLPARLYAPEDGALSAWVWDNGLTIYPHWRYQ